MNPTLVTRFIGGLIDNVMLPEDRVFLIQYARTTIHHVGHGGDHWSFDTTRLLPGFDAAGSLTNTTKALDEALEYMEGLDNPQERRVIALITDGVPHCSKKIATEDDVCN